MINDSTGFACYFGLLVFSVDCSHYNYMIIGNYTSCDTRRFTRNKSGKKVPFMLYSARALKNLTSCQIIYTFLWIYKITNWYLYMEELLSTMWQLITMAIQGMIPPTLQCETSGLEKMFISLQAGQNFPPAGQISLQCGMISLMYFFIFPSNSQTFLARSFPFCLFFPGLVKHC